MNIRFNFFTSGIGRFSMYLQERNNPACAKFEFQFLFRFHNRTDHDEHYSFERNPFNAVDKL